MKMNVHRSMLWVVLIGVAAAALPPMVTAQAGASPYQFALPAGWTRAQDGDVEVLSPGSEPAGSVQVLVLAPKPATGDFGAQFAAERATLEQFWGLRAPQPASPQSGQAASGPYAAYFASYDSDGGPRYMSFLAQAQRNQFAMVVFVAASHDSFNRLAPQATEMFRTLQLVR
jgi:hypothetical protein